LKQALSLRSLNLALVVLLILVMGSQLGLELPLGKPGVPITLGDAVLAVAAVGVALQLLQRRLRGAKLPPLQCFAIVAAGFLALARSQSKPEAAKEVLQLIEYFLVAYAVFANVAETGDVRALLAAFAAATGLIVLWAGCQYFRCDSALDVRAGFKNRNALGAFLAVSLPVLYGLALHVPCWGLRLILLAVVAAGLVVNLSGGAVLVTLLVLGFLSALRGQRALLAYAVVLGLALFGAHKFLPRPHHTNILFSSIAPYVKDNFLLSDKALFARAKELSEGERDVMEKSRAAGQLIVPGALEQAGSTLEQAKEWIQLPEAQKKAYDQIVLDLGKQLQQISEVKPTHNLFDAWHLMGFLKTRRGGENRLTEEQHALYLDLEERAKRAKEAFPHVAASSAFAEDRVALRYRRWDAAIARCRKLWDGPGSALFGLGYVEYHVECRPEPVTKDVYRTDAAEIYNVVTDEPFTHDAWLKALLQTGLVGLLALGWLIATFLGRALRLYGAARSELMLGLALGLAGGILGFALAGIFTETVARGLAIPLVFLCVLVALAERIVHGEGAAVLEKIKPKEY